MNDTKSPKTVIIISGGTVSYIRPHFAVCAPAYGTVGNDIHREFWTQDFHMHKDDLTLINAQTKMAYKGSGIETTEDLSNYIDHIMEDKKVAAIVMAAAVCDFHAESISSMKCTDVSWEIGKEYERLKSNEKIAVGLVPSEKIVRKIKDKRPDIHLTTFKTVTNKTNSEMLEIGEGSMNAIRSDVTLINDIALRKNGILTKSGSITFYDHRHEAVSRIVKEVLKNI